MAKEFCNTVWLIDDDDLSNYVNEAILKTQHFARSIVIFKTVQKSLDFLDLTLQEQVDFPECIFLDMEMPGMDGWDFLKVFQLLPKEVKENCRLYMLSSSINDLDALKAKEYEDVDDFIVKPLTIECLENIKTSGGCVKSDMR